MVEPTGADVIGPAVAAHQPHALAHQRLGNRQQVARCRRIQRTDLLHKLGYAFPLSFDSGLVRLVCIQNRVHQRIAELRGQLRHQLTCIVCLFVHRQSHAQAKLGIVFEERIGPGWTAPLRIAGVRSCGQVAAVDRRAAGRIRDHQAIAKKLGEQLDIRRFTAARASSGKLEERFQQAGRLLPGRGKAGSGPDLEVW